MDADDVRANER